MFCPKQKTRFIPTEMAAIAAAASSHLMFVLRSQPLSSSFISFLKPLLLSIPQRCFYAPSTYPCSTASKTCLRYFLLRFLKMAKKQRLRMMNWKLKEVILKTCLRYFHFNWFTVSQCSFLVLNMCNCHFTCFYVVIWDCWTFGPVDRSSSCVVLEICYSEHMINVKVWNVIL